MNRLGEKSLKTLEYYEILERLAAQASSDKAKEKCRALRPLDDREQAALHMQQTTDAKDRMVRQGSPSFGGGDAPLPGRGAKGGTRHLRFLIPPLATPPDLPLAAQRSFAAKNEGRN